MSQMFGSNFMLISRKAVNTCNTHVRTSAREKWEKWNSITVKFWNQVDGIISINPIKKNWLTKLYFVAHSYVYALKQRTCMHRVTADSILFTAPANIN